MTKSTDSQGPQPHVRDFEELSPSAKQVKPLRRDPAPSQLPRWLANLLRGALQKHIHAVDNADQGISGSATNGAVRRQRVQSLRNAAALARTHASFDQGSPEHKTYSLSDLVSRCAQHANSNGDIVVEKVHGVAGNLPLHTGSCA